MIILRQRQYATSKDYIEYFLYKDLLDKLKSKKK